MTIGIFEMEHFEGAYPVIRLFDLPGNSLVIYTNDQTFNRFRELFGDTITAYSWVIRRSDESLYHFLLRVYRDSRNRCPDLLYFNTISNNHLLYALLIGRLKQTRVVITVHDINCLFKSAPGYSFKSIVRHIGKKRLTQLVKEFNVVSSTMTSYLQNIAGQDKKIHNIPGAVFEHRKTCQQIAAAIRLVVPGSIDNKRRDYARVFDLLQLAERQGLTIDLVILGGYVGDYGKEILVKAKTYTGKFTRVLSYETDLIHQEEFDRQLDEAHFIFIPSVVETTICGSIPEVYGITKSSGNIFDVIKHAKPFIIPERLNVGADLHPSCFGYFQLEEIVNFLLQLIRQPEQYADWQARALLVSEGYTIERMRKENASLFTC